MSLLESIVAPFQSDRQTQRKRFKELRPEVEAYEGEIKAVYLAIAATKAEIDHATAQHVRSCKAIHDRADAGADLELRLQLRAEIDLHNETRDEICDRANAKIDRLLAEERRLVAARPPHTLETLNSELLRLAEPGMASDLRIAKGDIEGYTVRLALSERLLATAEKEARRLGEIKKRDSHDERQLEIHQGRVERNRLDMKGLAEALSAATQRASELQARIISE